jgi:hypothetical protein
MGNLGRLHFMRTAGGLTHRNALRKKLVHLAVTELVFLDDHKMLTDIDHTSDNWGPGGTRLVEKQGGAHWRLNGESLSASVTRGTRLRLQIHLSVDSSDADPTQCHITGTASLPEGDSGAPEAFTFVGSIVLGGSPSASITLSATKPLADQVFRAVDWTISWRAEVAGRTFDLGETGRHRLYVTHGTPVPGGEPLVTPFGADPPPKEDGITEKRMNAAVDLIERAWRYSIAQPSEAPPDRNDPHLIARAIMSYVPGYTLSEPPPGSTTPDEYALLKDTFGHPAYFKSPGGAWPIYDHPKALAECQAIVRFARGILMQAGVPGEAAFVVVYADADGPAGPERALVDSVIPRDSDSSKYRLIENRMTLAAGLNRDSLRIHNGVPQTPWLADSIVEEPRPSYPNPEPVRNGTVLNKFEACMRFTHNGLVRFYGGGIQFKTFETPQRVIRCFKQLVWTIPVGNPKSPDWFVTEIAYPRPSIGPDGEPEYYDPDGDPKRWPD